MSKAYLEAEEAWARVGELKKMFGEGVPSLAKVKFDDLVRSASLRHKILDYTKMHFV